VDNLFVAEEAFRDLPAYLQTMVTEAISQGTTAALAAAQHQIGVAVNVQVVEQGFPPGSKDDDIDDLIESFKPAANVILAKVDMDEILHACLDP
jgi:hypothetical protein